MKYIYLMRHGEVDNPKKIVYGDLPGFHLSERGKRMALEAAKNFKAQEIGLSAIYSSPYMRALETAQIVAERLGLKVKTDKTIVDWDMGKWIGKNIKDFAEKSGYYNKPSKMDDFEPWEHAANRTIKFFESILSDMYEDEAVLVVSHRENSVAAILKLQVQNYEFIHDVRFPMGCVWLLKFSDDNKFVSAEFKWGGEEKDR